MAVDDMWVKSGMSGEGTITCWRDRTPIVLQRNRRIKGWCRRCGACCRLAGSLGYKANYSDETLVMEDQTYGLFIRDTMRLGRIVAMPPCPGFSFLRGCTNQKNKKPLCSKWPLIKTDLEVVACKGFSYYGS